MSKDRFYKEDLGDYEITLGLWHKGVVRFNMNALDGQEYAGFTRVVDVRFCDEMIAAFTAARKHLKQEATPNE